MRQLERRLAGSLIPQRFLGKTFENYRVEHEGQREALLDLQAYADDFADVLAQGRCLLLVGRTGTGKTHLSCAVANSIVRRGYTALFRTVQEVIRHVRSSWGPGGAPGGRGDRRTGGARPADPRRSGGPVREGG
ncbi:ATP-binding protein [Pseudomonas aeruginosa]